MQLQTGLQCELFTTLTTAVSHTFMLAGTVNLQLISGTCLVAALTTPQSGSVTSISMEFLQVSRQIFPPTELGRTFVATILLSLMSGFVVFHHLVLGTKFFLTNWTFGFGFLGQKQKMFLFLLSVLHVVDLEAATVLVYL